ncbi:MAG: LytTR family DNA-binding domain-containing protein [Zoogloeaceae bacterium]|jgi:two-component system response regulator AlgR|nr:LytTR family DNA-binding domain-containing protein [Zoogloeaceae bacterium]
MSESSAPLTLYLVDDESLARSRLRQLLSDIAPSCPTEILGEAGSASAALDWWRAEAAKPNPRLPEAALIDVHMPRMNGMELAGFFATLPAPPAIIFITAYEHHAVRAFDLCAVDYLLKPVRAQRLMAALLKVRAIKKPENAVTEDAPHPAQKDGVARRSHLTCYAHGRTLLLPLSDILYFRAELKYVTARTKEKEYVLDETLARLEEEFGDTFIRLHRAALVARNALASFERAREEDDAYGYALLRHVPDKLPISRRQWPLMRELFLKQGV